MMRRSSLRRVFLCLGLCLGLGLGSDVSGLLGKGVGAEAWASPHHAHWHYMVGARASSARNFCRQLHHEATTPGPLSLELARVNAEDIDRLAGEIGVWVSATVAANSDEENERIRPHLETMAATAEELDVLADELVLWIGDAIESGTVRLDIGEDPGVEDAAGLGSRVAERVRLLYQGFGRILQAHKAAELALGIPVPGEPPPPS